jgi:hypothetical protein
VGVTVAPLESDVRELLANIGEALLSLAVDVFDATPQGAPATRRYTVGNPVQFCCGAITVSLRRIRPLGQPSSCDPVRWQSDWTVDVGRDCVPNLGSVYNILPRCDTEQEFDIVLLMDAVSLYQQYAQLVAKRVTPIVRPGSCGAGCVPYTVGSLVPYQEGECVGWRFDFSLGLL